MCKDQSLEAAVGTSVPVQFAQRSTEIMTTACCGNSAKFEKFQIIAGIAGFVLAIDKITFIPPPLHPFLDAIASPSTNSISE